MNDTSAWIGAIAAVFSALAAALAAWAAKSSNVAATKMARIETARRHQELTPRLALSLATLNPGDTSHYKLSIELVGPVALQQVAGIVVRVRDDQPGRDQEPVSFQGRPATPGQLEAQIWGPLRLTPGLHHGPGQVNPTGRFIDIPDKLTVGDGVRLQMEPTQPPPWTGSDLSAAGAWWRDTVGTRVRLTVELRPVATGVGADEGEAWVLPVNLELDQMESSLRVTTLC